MLLQGIKREEMAFQALVDQHVGSAVFTGSKKATRALTKLLNDLRK